MTKAINRVAPSHRLGGWGEDAAAEHLMGLGRQVVARNWRGEGGEVDLLPQADLASVRELIIELHPHIVGDEAIAALIGALKARRFAETGRIGKNIRLSRQG